MNKNLRCGTKKRIWSQPTYAMAQREAAYHKPIPFLQFGAEEDDHAGLRRSSEKESYKIRINRKLVF